MNVGPKSPYKEVPFPPPETDSRSNSEQARAEEEERQLERDRAEHERDQTTRHLVGVCLNVLIVLIFFVILAAVATLGWHMLTPDRLHWLTDPQLRDVKNFMLSGALVSIGSAYLRRFLDKQ